MQRTMRILIPLLSFIILISTFNVTANNNSRLKQLNHKIANIKATLSHEQYKRTKYLHELKKTEINFAKISTKLKKTQSKLHTQRSLLQNLKHKAVLYKKQLNDKQQKLTQEIRAAYLFSRQPYLKLILNQSNIEHFSRTLMYYQYINHAQVTRIHQLQKTLSQMHANQQRIQKQTKILEKIKAKEQQERNKLKKIRHNRQKIIYRINSKIHTKHEKLTQLMANKQKLEQTLRQLKSRNKFRANQYNFAKLKGNLNWPTKGKVLPYFGTKIYHSQLKWGGILIQAQEDQPIYAIAAGQVVFAKWLPGYGLLLIIDHGHGYMTLYGRNHNIYKKPGDTVHKGELIATVGDSGGHDQSALYFAIRHNAKPLNPMNWCSNKV